MTHFNPTSEEMSLPSAKEVYDQVQKLTDLVDTLKLTIADQQDDIARNKANNHQNARTIVKPPKYAGLRQDNWVVFRGSFERVAELNRYTNDEAKIVLAASMIDNAAVVVSDIDPIAGVRTLEGLLDRYEAKFLPPAASALARAEFDRASQNPLESELQYHSRLRSLFRRAYPHDNHPDILIRRFSLGLKMTAIKEAVLRANPAHYDQALNVAQNERSVQINKQASGMIGHADIEVDSISEEPTLNALSPEAYEHVAAIEKETQKCFNCEAEDHLVFDCPVPLRPSRFKAFNSNRGPRGRGGGGRGGGGRAPLTKGKKPPPRRFAKKGAQVASLSGEVEDAHVASVSFEKNVDYENVDEEPVDEGDF